MNAGTTIRKVLFILLWVSIGGGMLTLLVAAIGRKNKENCSDYAIAIKGNEDNFFMDAMDVAKRLKTAVGSDIKGKKIKEINLGQLEQLLEKNVWIRNAELWFDNRSVMHVEVYEREPIARIFTTTNGSFYIDSTITRMPLSDKMMARIPMFTGFPNKKTFSTKDIMLLKDVKNMAQHIMNDPFWSSQIAQIDITSERNFELSPVIGNHLIKLGDGKNIEQKFNRLMIFYKQVLAEKGFDAYSTIDVQYTGQVVGTRRGTEKNKVDTVALKRNINEMLKRAQKQYDSIAAMKPIIEKPIISGQQVSTSDLRATSTQSTNPNAMKAKSLPTKRNEPAKAVMPKKRN